MKNEIYWFYFTYILVVIYSLYYKQNNENLLNTNCSDINSINETVLNPNCSDINSINEYQDNFNECKCVGACKPTWSSYGI